MRGMLNVLEKDVKALIENEQEATLAERVAERDRIYEGATE